ncbi:preprotein translocase subunit SecE [Mycolicibacterium sp. J2]|uniref:preprotein translocase subunit SecE n=1 Tax=Mycolicibacterium sp. J2 TaxID=2993511 RepID=UPI00224A8F75|nr:preprotein translocase subunit SecE [Mycolicibacterium sp. J2]MCX2712207.1 preprotein translocase subunit SecE [Mycolicibacterium sp. J2]
MSDERDSAGSEGTEDAGIEDAAGQTAVVTRPLRPTGKRTRRAAAAPVQDAEPSEADAEAAEGDDEPAAKSGKTGKTAKAGKGKKSDTKRVNPFAFVWNYLKQVVAELRKVIWPNRKQMVSYTTVVLVFLAFMVALIGGVDLGLAKLVSIVFG